MTGFRVLSAMKDSSFAKFPISSQTVLVSDLFERTTGATTWQATTATTNFFTRKFIAMEAASSSATEVLGYELDGTEVVEAEVTNTASADHNGDIMTLTDKNTVNNTGTNVTGQAASFIQDKLGSTTTSIIGRVLVGNAVDPDAA